jgi:PPP family 3-phenylpropionic acid transporter
LRPGSPVPYFLLYATLYGAFGVASPFWPKLFETKGLTPQQIGLILAASLVVRLAAGPLLARLADLLAAPRLVLASCAVSAAGAGAAFLPANTFWLVLLVAAVQATALAPTTSIADALTVTLARPRLAERPLEYGWLRGSASAAFLLGTLIVGQLIGPADLRPVIWMNVALLVLAAAATALIAHATSKSDFLPDASRVVAEVRGLLRLPAFRIVIVVSALVYGSHAMYDAFAVIRWSDAGLKPWVISVLWAEAVAAEVIVFFLVGPMLLRQLGVRRAVALAALAGVVRWALMSLGNSVVLLSILQPLHGITFALLHLACMRVMASVVAPGVAATAQAFYAFGSGLVTAMLTLLSGTLYAKYGGASFVSMAALCIVALPFAWFGLANDPQSKVAFPQRT